MADLTRFQGVYPGFLIDDRTARGVDEDDAGLHRLDAGARDQAARLVVQQQMDRNDVALGQQFVEIDELDFRMLLRRTVPGNDAHA